MLVTTEQIVLYQQAPEVPLRHKSRMMLMVNHLGSQELASKRQGVRSVCHEGSKY